MENIQRNLLQSLTVIKKYEWLLNAYVLDFYVDDHWSKLPSSWRTHLETLQPEMLSALLEDHEEVINKGTPWPLSLLALRKVLQNLVINRRQPNKPDWLPRSTILEHPRLKNLFEKGVKSKKRHEIKIMASLTSLSCADARVDFVIDFGAGLGHLARILGYGYGIRVCCLEMQDQLNDQAEFYDTQLERIAMKHLSQEEISKFQRPTHLNLCVTSQLSPDKLLHTIKESLGLSGNNFRFGIVGLHPCGDLAAVLIRLFLNCPQAEFLNLVGCCYMKLTAITDVPRKPLINQCGYPLSEFLRNNLKDSILSYEAREISCHACESYCDRLKNRDYNHLKIHSFRAAAESILIRFYPEMKHAGLKSVKISSPEMTFEDYFYKAIEGVRGTTKPNWMVMHDSVKSCNLMQWNRVVIFYTLRLMIAPLVESVLLYDRMLFLMENGCQVQIQAIFDPRLSPRNHITSAYKNR